MSLITSLNEIFNNPTNWDVTNARDDFLEVVDNRNIRCAFVRLINDDKLLSLPEKYSEQEYNNFLESMNFKNTGAEISEGFVWFDNGEWAKANSDGDWFDMRAPNIRKFLKRD